MAIHFFEEDIRSEIQQKRNLKNWIKKVAAGKSFRIGNINYIFCTDEYLLEINKAYLNHDTLTDIITFDQSERFGEIDADIYISAERIRENADILGKTYQEELRRVLIHGILHLCGHRDKSPAEKKSMREEEDKALNLFDSADVPRGTLKK
ncbi:rRNA maturation RNase YbeY [Cyclobacterium lianum]|uniref:Endoribonuclease YbeY n=1 Tax=Cyclobacterium lianum TaxID=388280 RepID=A0A1M7HS09_9BACT|nr:rRNA maturation RNase YbeY [Cyclobacterium lianum]SHM31296.1 rRNA maturation RNase YbeY [Cyclobacterium lianum]